jgi:hypothetical protein
MRPVHRWSLVAAACALVAAAPYAVRALPVHDPDVSAAESLALVRAGDDVPYSGLVEVQGHLGLPISEHFTDLADLLGSDSRLRVWWRSPTDWRVDRLLDTGEVDTFHHVNITTQWDYEREQAETSVDPRIRLPRDADLLPPALASRAVAGATPDEITRLPARRIAGVDAIGLRLVPDDPRTSVSRVDLWADPDTGLVLSASVYDARSTPAISSSFTSVSTATPSAETTHFQAAAGIPEEFGHPLDFADAANEFAPVSPPSRLAGLPRTNPPGGAVGVYGGGLTQLMAVPVQPSLVWGIAHQLRTAGASHHHGRLLLRAGPLGVLLFNSRRPSPFHWLIIGWVTDQTLVRASHELPRGAVFR